MNTVICVGEFFGGEIEPGTFHNSLEKQGLSQMDEKVSTNDTSNDNSEKSNEQRSKVSSNNNKDES